MPRPDSPTDRSKGTTTPPSQIQASNSHVDSGQHIESSNSTPASVKHSNPQGLGEAGFTKAKTTEIVNDHTHTQITNSTVVVEIDQLLAQAKPRNAEAAAYATDIHDRLRRSHQLSDVTDDLKALADGQCKAESAVYPGLKQLLDICARAVYDTVVELDASKPVRQETRLLQAVTKFDYVPSGSRNNDRPDVALVARPMPTNEFPSPVLKESWKNIAAIIEVKWKVDTAKLGNEPMVTKVADTYGQLGRYLLYMYTSQPNRRFAWSLYTIDTFAYVCLLTRDHAYRTHAINLATPDGRHQLAKFLIFWSLAGPAQFGLDPTIEYDATTQHWAITCFDDASSPPAQRVYYAPDDTIVIQSSLFGRRTIAFSVSKTPDEKPMMFIKDAWPVATAGVTKDDDLRNEIVLLRLIHKGFSENDPGVPYLKLEMGGVVQQQSHGDLAQDDDTKLAFGAIEAALSLSGSESKSPTPVYRVHRRMAMTPLAERLNTLDDFNQLIVVLADAMTCHYKLYNDHRIFHRDISTNNIMVVRENEQLQGILVDYDYAVHRDATSKPGRPERTGTLPFMSIGNLEGNDNPRTALDDWESLLYVICWLGTFGSGKIASGKSTKPSGPLPMLHRWLKGSMETVAQDKRLAMASKENFGLIPACFQSQPGHNLLRELAVGLHAILFFHPKCPGAQRVQPITNKLLKNPAQRKGIYDPLNDRVKYEEEITTNCYNLLLEAADLARFELLSISP